MSANLLFLLTTSIALTLGFSEIAQAQELKQNERLEIRSVNPLAKEVPQYGRLEVRLDLWATFDNPFDPQDIDVYCLFKSQRGVEKRVNAFYMLDCTRSLENDVEVIETLGKPYWLVRFTPDCVGDWRYSVTARDRTGSVHSDEFTFTVSSSAAHGFLRRNVRAPHVFAFDNGTPFVAIGENMAWGGKRGSFDYDDWLKALSEAGGNWVRIWMIPWHCGLEWMKDAHLPWDYGTFGGLGVYNLHNAWKLDTILETAAQHDVQVMVCLGTFGEFTTGGFFNEGIWHANPYNAANGGPCARPEDFWSNDVARRLYRQRLRYIAARYGWCTNIFAWEFWNEAHPTTEWVREMTEYLKGVGAFAGVPADPFGHLVSTTYGTRDIWELDVVDFTMTHHYGEANLPDHAPIIHRDAVQHRAFHKPHLMAEFGIDWRSCDSKQDPDFLGINMHNGLWSSVASGNAGTAMIWYWDSYVHPGNLYRAFLPVRRIVDSMDWNAAPWTPLMFDPPICDNPSGARRDLILAPATSWGRAPFSEFDIQPLEGSGEKALPTFFYGPWKDDLRTPIIFHVTYEVGGRFGLHVNSVSSLARFVIQLDGKAVLDRVLRADPPEDGSLPEYESTRLRKEYGSYEATYNKTYWIDVPAGSHTIGVDITGGDWLSIAQYIFNGYVDGRFANLNVYGISNGQCALVWVQNASHGWQNVKANKAIESVPAAKLIVREMLPGAYRLEYWDTRSGEKTSSLPTENGAAGITVDLPAIKSDIAVVLRRESSP